MKGTIKLKKAILIDGVEVKEVTYDTDKISTDLYLQAINRAILKGNGITGSNIKVDAGAHLTIGMYAVLADNPKYDITDIERISGPDIMQLVEIGMGFILGREDQTEEPSDQPSEPTPKRTTQTSQDSGK
jgi:hypothetical protein